MNLTESFPSNSHEKPQNHAGSTAPASAESTVHEYISYPPPDKGYAWVILAAGLLVYIITFGSFNAFGVFQTYYLLTVFKDVPAETVAWISTATIFTTFTGGLFASMIMRRLGIRYTCIFASLMGFVGLILSSLFTKVWHLVITQGIIYGSGCSILINVSVTMQALWFDKKKSLALGIVSAGGGFGAVILVPIVSSSIQKLSFQWAFRILAIIFIFTTLTGSFFFKERLPFVPAKKIVNFKLLKDPFTIILLITCFTIQWGYNTALLYFPASLKSIGATQSFATYYIMAFAAASAIGRLTCGFLASSVGPINLLIICQGVATILIFVLWLSVKTIPAFLAFYFFLGLFGINMYSIVPSMVGHYYQTEHIAQANALTFVAMGLATLIGIPITGKIFDSVGNRSNFNPIIIMSGCFYAASFLAVVYFRFYLRRTDPGHKTGPI